VDRTEARLSLAVLTAGALLVLGAGGGWWVAAAPEMEVEPVHATPVIVAPEDSVRELLPRVDNILERQAGTLGPEETFTLMVDANRDGQYALHYICLGAGDLVMRIKGTSDGELLYQVGCEGNLNMLNFTAAGTGVVVEAHRPGPEPAEVGIQVVDN
jgi:hypothetical protein